MAFSVIFVTWVVWKGV